MNKALQPPPLKLPHQPPAPTFVQHCPNCAHVVLSRLESRTHLWMIEHWEFAHAWSYSA